MPQVQGFKVKKQQRDPQPPYLVFLLLFARKLLFLIFASPPETEKKKYREHMEWLAPKLGIKKQEDWYGITGESFARNGGAKLLSHYSQSLVGALQDLYPERSWQPWLFAKAPRNFWAELKNQVKKTLFFVVW